MNIFLRYALIATLGLVAGASFVVGPKVWADRDDPAQDLNDLPLKELRDFTDVLDRIKRDYVEDTDDKALLESAIRGILAGLDPHSSYLDADAFKDLQAGTSGEFGGLGIEVGMEDGFIKVISPIDDTPAERAGVKAGDLIIRLDDTPVKGLTLNEAVELMRGRPNTEIVLTIVREGEDKPLSIKIVRDVIQIKSVKKRMLEPGFGYTRISQFQSRSAQQLREAIDKLKEENKGALKGMVLDLRNNPGGVLNGAVEISDVFLEKGLVVQTKGRSQGAEQNFNATPGDALNGGPLVVLVNGGSASASEIVAGALQDHRRAIIMGERTFGKGSVQTILPLGNGTAVKLTTARYYTPNGRSIQAEGIEPDIKLESLKLAADENTGLQQVKEADLSRHLTNDDDAGEKPDASDDKPPRQTSPESLARSDYQLYEALNLLKGLALIQAQNNGE